MNITDIESIKKRLESDKYRFVYKGHWLWLGGKFEDGYGNIQLTENDKPKSYRVHRISAHIYLGLDLSDKLKNALHKPECIKKSCYNPDHLYIGDKMDNMRDWSNSVRSQGTFPCGHSRDESNIRTGGYHCKICDREASRKRMFDIRTNGKRGRYRKPIGPHGWRGEK